MLLPLALALSALSLSNRVRCYFFTVSPFVRVLRTRWQRRKKVLRGGLKRAMHSLHHRDATRAARPRRVVSCSSRSDGSKKPAEPTKEVKSLICRTKLARWLFFPFSFFFSILVQSIHVSGGRMVCLSQDAIPRSAHATYSNEASSYNKRIYEVG